MNVNVELDMNVNDSPLILTIHMTEKRKMIKIKSFIEFPKDYPMTPFHE